MVKNKISKFELFYIVSYVVRCAEHEYQLRISKKYHLVAILAEKRVISP